MERGLWRERTRELGWRLLQRSSNHNGSHLNCDCVLAWEREARGVIGYKPSSGYSVNLGDGDILQYMMPYPQI